MSPIRTVVGLDCRICKPIRSIFKTSLVLCQHQCYMPFFFDSFTSISTAVHCHLHYYSHMYINVIMENGRLKSSKTGMSWLDCYNDYSVHLMVPWLFFFWNSLSNISPFLGQATGSVRSSDAGLSEFYCIWIIQL